MADITNPIKYSDLIKADNSIDDLIKKLDEANDAYMNLANNVKQQAGQLSQSLNGVTGATESGRRAIRSSSDEASKLQKAYDSLDAALSENAKKIAELNAIKTEQNRINKLTIQMNNSAEGSYNRLSAEYSLLKIQINSLSKEERENNKEAKMMVQRSKEVYEQMKQLQEATGKHQLNVGNYAEAAQGLRMELRNLTQQMAAMKLEGADNSEEYRRMSERAGQLRDAMSDATQEVSAMASDTSHLDTIMSGMTAASGGFGALIGAMELFGNESEDVQEAQKKLQSVMAITQGLTAVQNSLQKQSALMLGVAKIQTLALAKAEAYERLIKIQGTNATLGATIAQKAFNAVAKANPYVLLATALLSVVGALWALSKGNKEAAKQQKAFNSLREEAAKQAVTEITNINLLVAAAKNENLSMQERIKAVNILNRIVPEYNGNIDETTGAFTASKEALDEYIKSLVKLYEVQGAKEQLQEIGKEISLLEVQRVEQEKLVEQNRKAAEGNVQGGGNVFGGLTGVLAANKAIVDVYDASLDKLADINKKISEQQQKISAINERYGEDLQKAAIDEMGKNDGGGTNGGRGGGRGGADAAENENKERFEVEKAWREKETLLNRIAYATGVKSYHEFMQRKSEIDVEYNRMMLQHTDLTESERLNIEADYQDARKALSDGEKARQTEIEQMRLQSTIEGIRLRLETTREGSREELDVQLEGIEAQREAELAANRNMVEELRQDEADINAKYDAIALKQRADFHKKEIDQWANLMQSEIDLMNVSERKKEKLGLELEAERLRKIIELIESGVVQASAEELQTYKNQYQLSVKELKNTSSIDQWKDSLQESADYTLEILSSVTNARVQMAEAAVEAATKEVDAAKETLAAEREAAANGYANNQELAQKELDAAKENQRKAIAQKRKAQKQQQAIDTLTQISSLVTASAKMWAELGFPAAIAGIATMWASFAASKIMAGKLAKQQDTEEYGEGTVELLEGGSHASGHDIDLGTKKDGTRRRAEGGEYFAVINKRSSRRWRKEIPDVINSLNDGTFGTKYLNAYDTQGGVVVNYASDLSHLEGDVRRIREQGEERTYVGADGVVVTKYKNITRRIR